MGLGVATLTVEGVGPSRQWVGGGEGMGAKQLASHSEKRGGGIEWHCLWVYMKTGVIAACDKSSDDLHQIGSFSPSIWVSLSK